MPKPLTFAELGIEGDAAFWWNWVKRMKYPGTVPDRERRTAEGQYPLPFVLVR